MLSQFVVSIKLVTTNFFRLTGALMSRRRCESSSQSRQCAAVIGYTHSKKPLVSKLAASRHVGPLTPQTPPSTDRHYEVHFSVPQAVGVTIVSSQGVVLANPRHQLFPNQDQAFPVDYATLPPKTAGVYPGTQTVRYNYGARSGHVLPKAILMTQSRICDDLIEELSPVLAQMYDDLASSERQYLAANVGHLQQLVRLANKRYDLAFQKQALAVQAKFPPEWAVANLPTMQSRDTYESEHGEIQHSSEVDAIQSLGMELFDVHLQLGEWKEHDTMYMAELRNKLDFWQKFVDTERCLADLPLKAQLQQTIAQTVTEIESFLTKIQTNADNALYNMENRISDYQLAAFLPDTHINHQQMATDLEACLMEIYSSITTAPTLHELHLQIFALQVENQKQLEAMALSKRDHRSSTLQCLQFMDTMKFQVLNPATHARSDGVKYDFHSQHELQPYVQ